MAGLDETGSASPVPGDDNVVVHEANADQEVEVEQLRLNAAKRHITLSVRGAHDDVQVFYKIKRTQKLAKLMNAYCHCKFVPHSSAVFLYNDKRLQAERTPEEVEMDDGDEIDAYVHTMAVS